jgi:IS5 family transposase
LLGKKNARQENLFGPVRRETRVSRELQALKSILDLSWFREAVKDKFVLDNGRPSITPEVLGAIVVLGYWFNITSDRELCEECEDRLSFREFIGISDEDPVPVHSSLTHWRQRLGRDIFRGFLEKSIEAAMRAGLKPGRCRMFDSTLVKAQADASGPGTVKLDVLEQTNDYLEALGEWEDAQLPVEECEVRSGEGGWKAKENKRKIRDRVVIQVNTHDVQAKLLSHPNKKTDFYHKCHFEFDASSGLVMNADAGHVADAYKMVEFLVQEDCVDTVVGDKGYFTGASQQWLADKGISSMISAPNYDNSGGRVFGLDAFAYDESTDEFICPAGQRLHRIAKERQDYALYFMCSGICPACELHEYCFQAGQRGLRRSLKVSVFRQFTERARSINRSWRYRRLITKRAITCEGSFANMKHYGGLGRARGVGEEQMAIQAMMAGAVYNLKKVLRFIANRESAAQSRLHFCCCRLYMCLQSLLLKLWCTERPNRLTRQFAA